MCIISAVTTHCCQLIVRCKSHLVDDICYREMYKRHRKHEDIADERITRLRQKLMDEMDYADIGRLAVGNWGALTVNTFVCITQTCFCIQYCIFVGSIFSEILTAFNEMTEMVNVTVPELNRTSEEPVESIGVPLELLVFLPVLLFVPLTLFRNVRQMGAISITANLAVFVGFCSVILYILLGKWFLCLLLLWYTQ